MKSGPFVVVVGVWRGAPEANDVIETSFIKQDIGCELGKHLQFVGVIANCGIEWGWWCSHRGAFYLLPKAVHEREHVVFHDQDKAII
eukprot:9820433-Ditylum_brightwellii.AAC.1